MSLTDTTAIIASAAADVREEIGRCARRIPNLRIVAEAKDGKEAFLSLATHRPDIAVLDVLMPLYTGKEVLEELRRRNLETRVLLMTAHDCPEYLAPAFWSDALGYLYTGDGLAEWIVPALKAVMQGRSFVSPTPLEVLRTQYASFSREQPIRPSLSGAEVDILKLTVRGKSDKEMANALDIPVRTIEKRKARLRRKIGVSSTVELAVYAVTQRLFEPEDFSFRGSVRG
jgi:two-component system nitrate/nitrite response regulator NarL